MEAVSRFDAEGRHSARRVVTILFADVVGSTAMGESLDPEAVRRLMDAWFAGARTVIESHGGTVEKFVGDAVMAVFGVPTTHEDDALRAVRAAAELAVVARLAAADRAPLEIRIGLATGEVVVADPESGATFVTGDPVNTAARLQAAAEPGEILLGEATYHLVRGAISADPVEPLVLRGKREPVAAFRLVSVDPSREAITRRVDTPMVGRDAELRQLRDAFERASTSRAPAVATIIGSPGIGKSRLVHELAAAARATGGAVLQGRCLPYGSGITYWPIAELVRAAAGVTADDTRDAARAKIVRLVADAELGELVGRRVASLLGLLDEPAPVEETTWAIRRLLEHLARQTPLVVVVDDLQWAEPGLLDLLAHVADLARDAPLLMVLIARPELAERHPEWAMRPGATLITLDTLPAPAAESLVDDLFPDRRLDPAVRERITAAAEGNPLYLEQYTAMLHDEGWLVESDGRVTAARPLAALPTPASVGALLAARLDGLPEPERRTAERASVVGRTFWWGAVREMSPEPARAAVGGSLTALVRRGILLPDRSEFAGDEAYRFRHLLIRDAAYGGLSKAERADLHERFAAWLESRAGSRVGEYEEILGYHLAEALGYREALDPADPRVPELRRRAVDHILAAGRRAQDAGDASTASALLGRADALLLPDDPLRHELAGDLAVTLAIAGRLEESRRLVDEETARLPEADPPTRRAVAAALILPRLITGQVSLLGEDEGRGMVRGLEDDGNDLGLAYAWHAVSFDRWLASQVAEAEAARAKAVEHARRAGARRLEYLPLYGTPRTYGPLPIRDGIADAERELAAAGDDRMRRAYVLGDLAGLRAIEGDLEAARRAFEEMMGILRELGQWLYVAAAVETGVMVERFAGDPGRGYDWAAAGFDQLRSLGATGYAEFHAAMMALLAALAGRWPEVEDALALFDRMSAELGSVDALGTAFTERARAMQVAATDPGAAASHAALALEALAPSDYLLEQAEATLDLARYLAAAGRPAKDTARRALALAEAKGYRKGAAEALTLLETVT